MPPSVHVAKAMSGSWLWCCFKIWEQLHYRPISSHTPRFLGETRKGRQSPGVPIRWAHRAETQVDRRLDQKSPKTPGSKNRWRFWNPKSSDVLLYFCRTSRPDPSWINISSPRGPFGGYFGRDWKWSSPVARGFEVTSESASRTAENDADGLLGHPKNAKAGSLFCVKWPLLHPAVLQPSFSPTDGENGPLRWIFFVVSWRDTPLFSETTLHKSSETERHIPKPEVIFRNYVGFRNLFLLYWEINTTGSTHTVQQLHITTWFRVYFGLSNQTSNQ